MALASVETLIANIRAGKMVILMDDEDRENEGDLVLAGAHCTPEHINFMARYARGLICLTLLKHVVGSSGSHRWWSRILSVTKQPLP